MQTDHSTRTWGVILLLVALLSGSALMIPFLRAGPLTLDEHGSYWLLESDVPSTVLQRSVGYAAIPPLSAWVQLLFVKLGGRSEFVLRLSSAVPFVLAIGVVFQLGRELAGDVAGGLAGLMLAWHPESMDEVRIARCYGLVLLLSAISFWATVRWIRSPARWDYAILWGLTGAGLLWTHYLTAPVLALELVALVGILRLDPRSSHVSLPPLIVVLVAICVASIPLIPALIRMAEWNVVLSFGQQPTSLWALFGPIWVVGLPAGYAVAKLMSLAKAGASVDGFTRKFTVFLVWGLVPLLLVAVATNLGLAGLNNSRYRVAFAVPGVCCLGLVLSNGSRPWAASLGTCVLLAAAWCLQPNPPWLPMRVSAAERFDWQQIATKIEQDGHSGEPVFVQSGLVESYLVPVLFDDSLFMDYVGCRVGKFYLRTPHPRYALPFLWSNETKMMARFRELILEHRRNGHSVWVASATDTDLCRNSLPAMQSLLQASGYHSAGRFSFSAAELIRYETTQLNTAESPFPNTP